MSHITIDRGGWSGWSVSLLFSCNNNRFSRDKTPFITQHFVLVIVLPEPVREISNNVVF